MYVITYSYSCHARTLVTWKAPQTTARMSVNVFNLLNGSYKSKHWQKRGERTRAHCSLQNDYLLGLAKCEATPIIYTQVTIQSLTLWLPIINSQNAQFNVSRWYKVNNNDLKQHASLLIGNVYYTETYNWGLFSVAWTEYPCKHAAYFHSTQTCYFQWNNFTLWKWKFLVWVNKQAWFSLNQQYSCFRINSVSQRKKIFWKYVCRNNNGIYIGSISWYFQLK